MDILFIFMPILVLALSAWGGYFVSTKVYNTLKKSGSKNAVWVRVLVFIGSFVIIAVALLFLFLANVSFER